MRIRKTYKICFVMAAAIATVQVACKKYDQNYSTPDSEWLSGGQQTVYDQNSSSFSHVFPVLPEGLEVVHEIGDLQFGATFVPAPAPTNPGRGPIFNNVSCGSCHIADGRGKVAGIGDTS